MKHSNAAVGFAAPRAGLMRAILIFLLFIARLKSRFFEKSQNNATLLSLLNHFRACSVLVYVSKAKLFEFFRFTESVFKKNTEHVCARICMNELAA